MVTASDSHPAISAIIAEPPPKSYLEKLFGNLGGRKAGAEQTTGPNMGWSDWLLAIPATIFYGPVALAAILWILFTSSLFGIFFGLLVVGLGLAFTLPRRPRPIALFILSCLLFLLAAGITLVVAFEEGVPSVLISLLPTATLVWLTFRAAFLKRTG